MTHEYGHHIAANRANPPWAAVDWGTKRWASYVNVCARARAGRLFPGAEDSLRYTRNPGEAFAESYRLLNERRSARAETPWEVVDRSLYPDGTALALLEHDVVSPWTANARTGFQGSFSVVGRPVQTYAVTAAYDGTLAVTLRAPARLRLSLAVLERGGRAVARARTTARFPTARVRVTVCETRSFRLRVTRLSGSGRFGLDVSKP